MCEECYDRLFYVLPASLLVVGCQCHIMRLLYRYCIIILKYSKSQITLFTYPHGLLLSLSHPPLFLSMLFSVAVDCCLISLWWICSHFGKIVLFVVAHIRQQQQHLAPLFVRSSAILILDLNTWFFRHFFFLSLSLGLFIRWRSLACVYSVWSFRYICRLCMSKHVWIA